uniref:Glycosyltransferase N-terminal domain-containing protein n=1 Tax=Salix viminalis TaxID=40686 RepID=A0A6N2KBB6_SALVM
MASQSHQLHFVLFPLIAQGHLIPMFDIARMLARHGVIVTIVTTQLNAKRFAIPLARAAEAGLQIRAVEIQFSCQETGLPNEIENFDMLPSLGLGYELFMAANTLQEPVERLFEGLTPRPSCIISDMSLPYTSAVAIKFGIPRISFKGFSCFCTLCLHNIKIYKALESVNSESELFVVPGLPDHIELASNHLPASVIDLKDFSARVSDAEMLRYGFIINSFEELEPAYVQEYRRATGGKVWCVGPVSLSNKDDMDKVHRGNKSSIDESECLEWLDSQQPGSVIYVCFGSLCNLTTPQLMELGLGLEESNKPFIWVIRGGEKSRELGDWFEEKGFKERTKGRGLIIQGWAPQVVILSHPAIGSFLTHCGWNSVLEGISAGLPMVTWPLFGDQFCNEKLVVEVLKIGVSVGSEVTLKWGEEEKFGVLVKNAVNSVMNVGEESEERRRRARELGKMANKAVEEEGSSYLSMKLLIEDIRKKTFVDRRSGAPHFEPAVSESRRYGFIINSFEELEPAYVQEYKRATGGKVWCVGPVSLSNKDDMDKVHRGNKSSIDESECLKWLDSQQPGSVIYVCFGSLCNLTIPQLMELGLGLEESNKPFIWVTRGGEKIKRIGGLFEEKGFKERTKGRGLIIQGWAPQVVILSHPAIGSFLTHCGWNSVLEGISAGLPMVTWPLFGDQFCNEKLVVEVLKIGVSVGSQVTLKWGEEEKFGVLVKKEQVKNAVSSVMNVGEESEERRRRVRELGKMANKAVEEEGSSYLSMKLLIEDIRKKTFVEKKGRNSLNFISFHFKLVKILVS